MKTILVCSEEKRTALQGALEAAEAVEVIATDLLPKPELPPGMGTRVVTIDSVASVEIRMLSPEPPKWTRKPPPYPEHLQRAPWERRRKR